MKPLAMGVIIAAISLGSTACQKKGDEPSVQKRDFPIPSPRSQNPPSPYPEDERLTRVNQALWQSPLGQLLSSYLFDSGIDQRLISHQIVDRIYKGSGSSVTNISAVHMMVQDAYVQGRMQSDQHQRLSRLQMDLYQRQIDSSTYMGEGIAYIALSTFLAFLPLGYPPVRHSLKHIVRYIAVRMGNIFRSDTLKGAYKDIPPISTGAKKFELGFVIKEYFKYFGPVSFLYFFWFDWKESARGHSIESHLEMIKSPQTFDAFIDDLKQL